MNEAFFDELRLNETDIEGALRRLSNDCELYEKIMMAFPEDKTMVQLEQSIAEKNWDDAFTAAHALKGLSGNLGLAPLYHSLGQLVISIRAGRLDEVDLALSRVKLYYSEIISVIKNNFSVN